MADIPEVADSSLTVPVASVLIAEVSGDEEEEEALVVLLVLLVLLVVLVLLAVAEVVVTPSSYLFGVRMYRPEL